MKTIALLLALQSSTTPAPTPEPLPLVFQKIDDWTVYNGSRGCRAEKTTAPGTYLSIDLGMRSRVLEVSHGYSSWNKIVDGAAIPINVTIAGDEKPLPIKSANGVDNTRYGGAVNFTISDETVLGRLISEPEQLTVQPDGMKASTISLSGVKTAIGLLVQCSDKARKRNPLPVINVTNDPDGTVPVIKIERPGE